MLSRRSIAGMIIVILTVSFIVYLALPPSKESPPLKVLVVQSYHQGFEWEQDIKDGIVEGLARMGYLEGLDYEMNVFFMDTKITYITSQQIQERAAIALDMIDEWQPDIVFVNNDNALEHVAVEYSLMNTGNEPPFVFSGINIDPTVYDVIESLEMPGGAITGALERIPYYEAFTLLKEIFPDASKIVILADSSPSSDLVVSTFQERYIDRVTDSPLEVIDYVQVETFNEWKGNVTSYQSEADILGILNYYQLFGEDGKVIPVQDVVNWTIHNNALPEMGFVPTDAEDGLLSAVGVSYYKTGIYVGIIGGEILDGRDPSTIPIIDPQVVDIAFNLERADMLGIKIPATALIHATDVYNKIPIND